MKIAGLNREVVRSGGFALDDAASTTAGQAANDWQQSIHWGVKSGTITAIDLSAGPLFGGGSWNTANSEITGIAGAGAVYPELTTTTLGQVRQWIARFQQIAMQGHQLRGFANRTSSIAHLLENVCSQMEPPLDSDAMKLFAASKSDAITFFQHNAPTRFPHFAISDDGIVSAQWKRDQRGVLLVFAGDGEVSYSFRRPGQFYAENGLHGSVSDPSPPEFSAALDEIAKL